MELCHNASLATLEEIFLPTTSVCEGRKRNRDTETGISARITTLEGRGAVLEGKSKDFGEKAAIYAEREVADVHYASSDLAYSLCSS